jgi:uncharacterized membrane protein YphA (DoxX/SURF4 family)
MSRRSFPLDGTVRPSFPPYSVESILERNSGMAPERTLSNGPWEFEYFPPTRAHSRKRRFAVGPVSLRRLETLEAGLQIWLAAHCITVTRIALGVVFLWFGLLKLLPEPCITTELAGRTINFLTFGVVPAQVAIPVLAVWECAIGVGLLTRRCMRTTIALLALQMSGTFVPLVLFPAESWTYLAYAPTLEGQYIIKNIVLVAAGMLLAATMRGGRVLPPRGEHSRRKRQQAVQQGRLR